MNNKIIRKIYPLIFTFLSMHIFILNLYEIEVTNNVPKNTLIEFFYLYRKSLNNIDIKSIILAIIIYYFYKNENNQTTKQKSNILLPLLLTIITIIGKSYLTARNSLSVLFISPIQFYKFIILLLSYFVTYYHLVNCLKDKKLTHIKLKENKFKKIWDNHPILISSLIIIICWLPYIIIFYPGGSTGDTLDSIHQFFHIDASWSVNSINLINQKVFINKHHSVLFTVLLGLLIKVGIYFNSFNLGFFLYVLLQIIIVTAIFTFMLYFMKKMNIPFWLILCSLIYIGLSPTIIQYSMTAVKDTLSASFTLLYIIFLLQSIRNYNSIFNKKKRLICLIITMLLVLLFRNNGIFTIIFSFPFLIIIYKKHYKKILEVLLLVLVIFISYNNILLPNLGVSNGSIKEMLSIPFMQIARTAKYHEKDFSKEEIKKINNVLDFNDIIMNYSPNISDGVKNTYKKNSTKEDNIELFKIWFKYLKKHPLTYIDSFISSSYGYIYPIFNAEDLDVSKHYLIRDTFPTKEIFVNEKEELNAILLLKYKSLFSIYFNIVGIINWILLFTVLRIIKNKKYKYLIPLSPLLITILVCMASPLNGCPRYILTVFFSIPIILSINFISEFKKI